MQKEEKKARIIETKDGSHTVISSHFGEAYHSKFGAIQESKHVFLQAGLLPILNKRSRVSILEIGFGTGLNAVLTYLETRGLPVHIQYDTIEAYPLEPEAIEALNYPQLLDLSPTIWTKIHTTDWEEDILLSANFQFKKHHLLFQEFDLKKQYDLIYYDAFAPEAQPELWDIPILTKMFDFLVKGGILVTYCAKGYVKRNLKAVGFTIESIPGPPGKREMTRAVKPIS